MQPTLKTQEWLLNTTIVLNRLKDQRRMRITYIRRGELGVVANIEAQIKQSEEALERYSAEYAAMINA